MQATVHEIDPATGAGSVITDNGRVLPFDADVVAAANLRHLRVGQRLHLELAGGAISRLWIEGVGPGQRIR
ncbi:hypothetical protein G9U51_01615 [Calidifontibacter sp. DB0510]|uniref:Uncharacterized protein n=1 Tax=Metallococcus carri TaxID=1656884 RepID=A0A967AWW8_9MICO|nr:hypothetical protein [Metallococcus carri]NHN54479.1 hypothetical protein [Metallococcus carri]NOP36682.1 hypothetical protein [Calidifontibacter sp. DB2511S]